MNLAFWKNFSNWLLNIVVSVWRLKNINGSVENIKWDVHRKCHRIPEQKLKDLI